MMRVRMARDFGHTLGPLARIVIRMGSQVEAEADTRWDLREAGLGVLHSGDPERAPDPRAGPGRTPRQAPATRSPVASAQRPVRNP